MNRQELTFKELEELEQEVLNVSEDVAYISLIDRSGEKELQIARTEISSASLLPYLVRRKDPPQPAPRDHTLRPRGASPDTDEDDVELEDAYLEPDEPVEDDADAADDDVEAEDVDADDDDDETAGDSDEGVGSALAQAVGSSAPSKLTQRQLLAAACQWIRAMVRRNMVGERSRRFRVRLYAAKGSRVLLTGSFEVINNTPLEAPVEEPRLPQMPKPGPIPTLPVQGMSAGPAAIFSTVPNTRGPMAPTAGLPITSGAEATLGSAAGPAPNLTAVPVTPSAAMDPNSVAVAPLVAPTGVSPHHDQALTGAAVAYRHLGDCYTQFGDMVLGSVSSLQNVLSLTNRDLGTQLRESRGQVDQLVASVLEFRTHELEHASSSQQVAAQDHRTTLARDAINQLGETAKAFFVARGVPPNLADVLQSIGSSPELTAALEDPTVREMLRDPRNLHGLAGLLKQVGRQYQALQGRGAAPSGGAAGQGAASSGALGAAQQVTPVGQGGSSTVPPAYGAIGLTPANSMMSAPSPQGYGALPPGMPGYGAKPSGMYGYTPLLPTVQGYTSAPQANPGYAPMPHGYGISPYMAQGAPQAQRLPGTPPVGPAPGAPAAYGEHGARPLHVHGAQWAPQPYPPVPTQPWQGESPSPQPWQGSPRPAQRQEAPGVPPWQGALPSPQRGAAPSSSHGYRPWPPAATVPGAAVAATQAAAGSPFQQLGHAVHGLDGMHEPSPHDQRHYVAPESSVSGHAAPHPTAYAPHLPMTDRGAPSIAPSVASAGPLLSSHPTMSPPDSHLEAPIPPPHAASAGYAPRAPDASPSLAPQPPVLEPGLPARADGESGRADPIVGGPADLDDARSGSDIH